MARSPRLRWISHFDWLIGWWFVCERDYWIDWSFVWCVYLWLCVMRRCGNNFDMLFQNKCIHRNSKKNLEYDIFIIRWFLKRISCKMTLRRSDQIIFIVDLLKWLFLGLEFTEYNKIRIWKHAIHEMDLNSFSPQSDVVML